MTLQLPPGPLKEPFCIFSYTPLPHLCFLPNRKSEIKQETLSLLGNVSSRRRWSLLPAHLCREKRWDALYPVFCEDGAVLWLVSWQHICLVWHSTQARLLAQEKQGWNLHSNRLPMQMWSGLRRKPTLSALGSSWAGRVFKTASDGWTRKKIKTYMG